MNKVATLLALSAACVLASCGKTGMGAAVRADVAARMQAAQPSIATCYANALARNRKLRGMLVLSITAKAKSGELHNITVSRDEIGDAEMKTCVIDEIAKQKLEKPQDTNITFSYPLRFSPTK